MKVYVLHYGNYFPVEVEAVYSNREAAEAHRAALKDSAWEISEWTVSDSYEPER